RHSVLSQPYSSIAPPPTPTHTPSLHDALPIYYGNVRGIRDADQSAREPLAAPRELDRDTPGLPVAVIAHQDVPVTGSPGVSRSRDRKSTRLNSSHEWISYAVFCLKKKNK